MFTEQNHSGTVYVFRVPAAALWVHNLPIHTVDMEFIEPSLTLLAYAARSCDTACVAV
jgi:hypothetical protein